MLCRFIIFLALLLAPAIAQAQHIRPQLVAEGPAPAGGEVELAIVMHTSPGWHGYWLNPGDAGLPMEVNWHLPTGFSAAPLRYPVPGRLKIAGLMNYVFDHDYAVLERLKVPADARGTIRVRANARWLACTDKVCVPEQGELSLDLPVGTGTPNRARFDQWRQGLPRPLGGTAHFQLAGATMRVGIPLPRTVRIEEPYVFPVTDGAVDYAGEQHFSRNGDLLIAELPRKPGQPGQFAGVLSIGKGRGLEFTAMPGAVPAAERQAESSGWQAVLWAVLGAIAGGILLNLMPCVFPILALKALHISRAGGDAGEARSDALSYTAGAVVGTGALGVLLLGIRAAGSEVGWAFQLQDPRTIMLLLLLAVAITANLLGLFELPVLGGRLQPAGSFGTGALAAFIATPCAGPFLGAALGAALLLPLAGSLAVFAALGLGLALPFLLIAFIPPLRKLMPKPGAWMDRLKRFLAIPMGASAVAALWLLSRQSGQGALLFGLFASAALIVCLYFAGSIQRAGRPQLSFVALLAVVIVVVAVARVPSASGARSGGTSGAAAWSEARLGADLQHRRAVFVYFTADWCLTCKVNEAAAIDRSEVRAAFRKANVDVLAGDWTNGDPAITRFLESRGRAGVPFYLWYAPGKPPEELPQVLTPSMLVTRAEALRR